MALMTGKEYIESLRKMNMRVYMFGKKVENPVDDPILRPSVNSVRMTYDLATGTNPEYVNLMTAVSNLTGEQVKIEMFCHGALCMAVSGKCYMSLHQMDSSANRGSCTQICRRAYDLTDRDTGQQITVISSFVNTPLYMAGCPV